MYVWMYVSMCICLYVCVCAYAVHPVTPQSSVQTYCRSSHTNTNQFCRSTLFTQSLPGHRLDRQPRSRSVIYINVATFNQNHLSKGEVKAYPAV